MKSTLGPSELLVTPSGRIYHLNLLPEELADTVITVGDPDRVAMISKHFDRIEVRQQHREFITHTGTIGNKRLTVVSTGIGTPNIDIVMNELDALANIDLQTREFKQQQKSLNIVRLGTCGGLHDDIALGSYILTTTAIGLDGLLHFYQSDFSSEEKQIIAALTEQISPENMPIKPYVIAASEKLRATFSPLCVSGITATCLGFYAPQNRQLRCNIHSNNLMAQLRDFNFNQQRIVNFEMETAAIYGLSRVFQHNCGSISLMVAHRFDNKFLDNFLQRMEGMIIDLLPAFVELA